MLLIISGGQSGVDRAALDAALALGVGCGGWCPQGRRAEDGVIADRYPLKELPGADYLQRTERNVIDSDATLIIHFATLSGGTARTLEFCRLHARPHLLIDGERLAPTAAGEQVLAFIRAHDVERLNVAGPRASGDARAYPYARQLVGELLLLSLRR
jgi:hypothetical protein